MHDLRPPGFTGLDPNKPITIHRRHLPHWRQEGATYFVTFRLGDSLPAARLASLREERDRWYRTHPDPAGEELAAQVREHMKKVEAWLDQGHGACVLENREVAEVVENTMRYFDGERYELFSFVIMPNHVHACLKPLGDHDLDVILQNGKGYSAHQINDVLGRSGPLWQEESFDRIVRDTKHLRRVIRYIEANPEKAGVHAYCWTTPAWNQWLGRKH